MVAPRQSMPSWIGAAATARVDIDGTNPNSSTQHKMEDSNSVSSDFNLGFAERSFAAAGAAVISAVIVNPLDVAKTRLQAQAAGVPYQGMCGVSCYYGADTASYYITAWRLMVPGMKTPLMRTPGVPGTETECSPECGRYKGTLDVFNKVVRQEGFRRLWRGTNASLALAVPTVGIYLPCYDIFRLMIEDFTSRNSPALTPYAPLAAGSVARTIACITCYPVELARTRMQAFRETQVGVKPPGVLKTLTEVVKPARSPSNLQNLQSYRFLWTGLGAQLARDVPFSAICWSTIEPIRRRILNLVGDEAGVVSILGANFSAGFLAGIVAAGTTCPLDVAKTRRQIERDLTRALNMTTRQTLVEIWRDGGMKGLFAGVGPRVARAGPSVGIVVSFYEVVKYALHRRHRFTESKVQV